MKLHEIYARKITRAIDPVAVVSKLKEGLIQQEIEEYIFTNDLLEYLYRFLNVLLNSKSDKTGVWINGYYGCGKSHFLKFIYYCLHPTYREKALGVFQKGVRDSNALLDVSDAKVKEIRKKLAECTIDSIMFNIDTVAGRITDDEAITKILVNQLNQFRGYNDVYVPLAKLEKLLDEQGKFNEFKEAIKQKFKESWTYKAPDLAENYLDDLLAIAEKLIGIDIASTRAAIERSLEGSDELTVKQLVVEIKDFLSKKPEQYRLVFLIDEVSQYIGSNLNLLLNLQSIVEELGSKCGNQVWMVCTAQQEIKEVADNAGMTDYGKIMARFETKLPLQSTDASEITKKRVLDKKSEGIGAVTTFFEKHKGIIENQFISPHNLYKTYSGKDDFIASYPFVPYQFQLISDVFKSFSDQKLVTEGVKNTERSILGITHFTAKKKKDEEVGYFIPFDAFFNESLKENLTILATTILEMAYRLDGINGNVFAIRVVNCLFILSHLKEQYQAILPASLDNLVFLLMDKVDEDKNLMKKQVLEVLDNLSSNGIIIFSEGRYRFLGEDERLVLNEIKTTRVISENFSKRFFEDILEPLLNISRRISFDGNAYDINVSVDGKEFYRGGVLGVSFIVHNPNDPQQIMLQIPSNDIGFCLNRPAMKDTLKEFNEYVQIMTYISNNSDTATSKRRETLLGFKDRANIIKDEVKKRIGADFLRCQFISMNQVQEAAGMVGADATTRYFNIVQKHFSGVFRKKNLANGYSQNEADLRRSALVTQTSTEGKRLAEAEKEVDQFITMAGDKMVVGDIVKKMKEAPFGWKDMATLDVLLHLSKKNRRKFNYLNEPLDARQYAEKAINSRERDKIEVLPEKELDLSTLQELIHITNSVVFNKTVLDNSCTDPSILFSRLKEYLSETESELAGYRDEYAGTIVFGMHFKNYHEAIKKLSDERDREKLFTAILSQAENLRGLSDNYKEVREFVKEQYPNYKTIREFSEVHATNFSALELADIEKGELLRDYFLHDDKPGNRFPQVKRAYDELKRSIQALIKNLQDDAVKRYNEVFGFLLTKADEFGVEQCVLPDLSCFIERLKKINTISELRLKIRESDDFKTEQLKHLLEDKKRRDEKAGKKSGSAAFVSLVEDDGGGNMVEIKTEADLEKFISDLKRRIKEKLDNNQTVYLK